MILGLVGAEGSEVISKLWGVAVVELKDESSSALSILGDVEVDLLVS